MEDLTGSEGMKHVLTYGYHARGNACASGSGSSSMAQEGDRVTADDQVLADGKAADAVDDKKYTVTQQKEEGEVLEAKENEAG